MHHEEMQMVGEDGSGADYRNRARVALDSNAKDRPDGQGELLAGLTCAVLSVSASVDQLRMVIERTRWR
jgi:hypothetical protein